MVELFHFLAALSCGLPLITFGFILREWRNWRFWVFCFLFFSCFSVLNEFETFSTFSIRYILSFSVFNVIASFMHSYSCCQYWRKITNIHTNKKISKAKKSNEDEILWNFRKISSYFIKPLETWFIVCCYSQPFHFPFHHFCVSFIIAIRTSYFKTSKLTSLVLHFYCLALSS